MTDENTTSEQPQKNNKVISVLKTWLPFAVIAAVIYFGNVEIQSHLGRQALAETGMEIIPFDEAITKAQQENKLILADMSAIWCPTCRKLDSEVFSDQNVKDAIDEKYIFTRIEYESQEGESFMKRYNVSGFPTILIIDQNGEKLKKLPLTFNPKNFISLL